MPQCTKEQNYIVDFTQNASVPDDVLMRVLDGESVILNLNSESYFGLDEVGTRIWTVVTEAPSIQVGYNQLLEEYDVEPDVLRKDIDELLTQLVEHGLIELDAVPTDSD